jgi:hypothetical protein
MNSSNRTEWETPRESEKKAYRLRKQEEQESLRAMDDYLRHKTEEIQDQEGTTRPDSSEESPW